MKIPKTISAIYGPQQNKKNFGNKAARSLLTCLNTFMLQITLCYGSRLVGTTETPFFQNWRRGGKKLAVLVTVHFVYF